MYNNETKVSELDKTKKKNLKQLIPKLKFDLDPNVFFAKCVIIVEGDSDKGFMEGLDARMSLGIEQKDVLISTLDGKDNLSTLIKIVDMFKIPYVGFLDKDALVVVNDHGMSRVLTAISEIDSSAVNELVDSLGQNLTEYETKEPRWSHIFKNELKTKNDNEIQKFVESIIQKNSIKMMVFKKSTHNLLWEFAEKRRIFVLKEGAIEQLMISVDLELYRKMEKEHPSKRMRARNFVELLDESKLAKLVIPKKVLEKSIELAK